jgi:hypothetical protein
LATTTGAATGFGFSSTFLTTTGAAALAGTGGLELT